MSGFDPIFDSAGTGSRAGPVPAPGSIDGRTFYLRADGSWAVPVGNTPGPEPPTDPTELSQWACNIAGYLTYEVCRIAVKLAVDWVPVSWIGDIVGGITAGVVRLVLAEDPIIAAIISDMVFHFVQDHIVGLASGALTNLLDDVLWAKVHCALYTAIAAAPTDFAAALTAAAGVIGAFAGYTAAATAAIAYFLQHLGITSVANIPLSAFIQNYDCSTCATTGIGPAKPVLQTAFDLTITDGTHNEPFTDTVDFVGATVSGSGSTATVTPNNATSTTVGVSRPDNTTIAVSGTGVYSVLNGQLATINLDQLGAFTVNSGTGTTISGLTVGNTYALQSTGGPWHPHGGGGGDDAYSWEASVDGSTWQPIFALGNGASLLVTTPAWALSAAQTDSTHARVVWVATATSVRVRITDDVYGDNTGSLGWQLLDVVYEGSEILVQHGGTKVATRPVLDFVDSGTVTATVTDDSANDRVTVSLAATATGGGTVGSVTSVSGTAPVAVATGTTTPVVSVGVFDGHGGSHPTGLVPDPGASGATTSFLRADGTFTVPPGTGGAGTVTSVSGTAPITVATGTTTPVIALTTPLGAAYGGTGLDTSAVSEGDLLVGTSSHTWIRGTLSGGTGIGIAESGGVFTISATGTGAGGTAMTLLSKAVVAGSPASSVLFTIGSGYSHLYFMMEVRSNIAGSDVQGVNLQFNSDTGNNYNWQDWYGNGGTLVAQEGILDTHLAVGICAAATTIANEAGTVEMWVFNYLGTTFHKHTQSRTHVSKHSTSANVIAMGLGGTWLNTAAITSVLLYPALGSFIVGSTIWVYGIA